MDNAQAVSLVWQAVGTSRRFSNKSKTETTINCTGNLGEYRIMLIPNPPGSHSVKVEYLPEQPPLLSLTEQNLGLLTKQATDLRQIAEASLRQ